MSTDQSAHERKTDIREIWVQHGGAFHGPHVETGTMPESKLLPFLRDLLTAKTENEALRKALHYIENNLPLGEFGSPIHRAQEIARAALARDEGRSR